MSGEAITAVGVWFQTPDLPSATLQLWYVCSVLWPLPSKPVTSLWVGTVSCALLMPCPYRAPSGSKPIHPSEPTGNPRASWKEAMGSSSQAKQHIVSYFPPEPCKTKSYQVIFFSFSQTAIHMVSIWCRVKKCLEFILTNISFAATICTFELVNTPGMLTFGSLTSWLIKHSLRCNGIA